MTPPPSSVTTSDRPAAAPDATCPVRVTGLGKTYRLYRTPAERLAALFGRRANDGQRFQALHDVTFDVRAGEAMGVIGRNGAGKSTLLQILAGTLRPTTGAVGMRGRVTALLELGSGFNPEFTGRENVFLNGAILGFGERELHERFEAIAAFADIGPFINQPVKLYSSGMFVRLAFAVQASLDPAVLLVDEALSVGDIFFQQKCMLRIRELLDAGAAVVLVTHDLNTVSRLCDRALLLDEGRVVQIGPPKPVLETYIALSHGGYSTAAASAVAEAGGVVLEPIPPAAPRHGDGGMRITGFALRRHGGAASRQFPSGAAADLVVEIEAREDGLLPSVGLQVLDRFGHKACTTNAFMKSAPPPRPLRAGERQRATFALDLMLGEGEYTLTLAVASYEAEPKRIYDWVDRVAGLQVLFDPRSGVNGFAYCPVAMTYSEPNQRGS